MTAGEAIPATHRTGPDPAFFVLTGLALSFGWGVRGNFGHEYGAMLPGALAALAAVLLSGRDDWHRRAAYAAMFGALGWSFGGSMSYMQVVAYTHSGHSPSVLYGFVSLFVIGFLWAAPGGAGTAFALTADRDRLTGLIPPMTAVFVAWWLQGVLIAPWLASAGVTLNWYDTDWLAALLAGVAVLVLAGLRRRLDPGSALILHMAVGWWTGFVVLVLVLGLRMTPPRGDNWAGCLGLTVGLFVYLLRSGLHPVAQAMAVTGVLGGIGFAAASMLKLVEVTSGITTNWHSVLEQTTGLFNGLGLAVALTPLLRSAPPPVDTPRDRRWTEVYAVGFVVLGITYLNLRKNAPEWVKKGAVPAEMGGLPAWVWFELGFLALTLAVMLPLARHLRDPLPLIPPSAQGRAQWLFLVLLWGMDVGNFERALVGFAGQRLVTEGVVHLNAALLTLGILLVAPPLRAAPTAPPRAPRVGRTLAVGLAAALGCSVVDWAVVRAVYGDRFAGHANLHIRFGPNATTTPERTPRP